MLKHSGKSRAKDVIIWVAATIVITVIIWIDVATGLWSDLVILSGLAAGLVTFLLTALILNKILARSTARRWAPVNRLALTEFLYSIADDERSEISLGRIVPRALPQIDPDTPTLAADLQALRDQVVLERGLLSDALGTWAQFLASSGNNEEVMRHIAEVALQLHRVRDVTLEVESEGGDIAMTRLADQTRRCNDAMIALERELRAQILLDEQSARGTH